MSSKLFIIMKTNKHTYKPMTVNWNIVQVILKENVVDVKI